jgi:hypothetical protein
MAGAPCDQPLAAAFSFFLAFFSFTESLGLLLVPGFSCPLAMACSLFSGSLSAVTSFYVLLDERDDEFLTFDAAGAQTFPSGQAHTLVYCHVREVVVNLDLADLVAA